MVAFAFALLFIVIMSAYTYWRIASGRDVRPVRKERPWSWRYDVESHQVVPIEPVAVSTNSTCPQFPSLTDGSLQWPTWPTAEGPDAPTLRNPPLTPYNPLAEIDAKRATVPPLSSTIAISTSTSFHTIESLEDLRDGIYDTRRGGEHSHVCRTDLRRPGPARKSKAVPTITVAPIEEEADLTDLLHSPALFLAERRHTKVGHLAVPAIDHTGRIRAKMSAPAPQRAPLTRSTHNAAPPMLAPFTRFRRPSIPSSCRPRSSKENAPLLPRF
jgi:hypothetical protein